MSCSSGSDEKGSTACCLCGLAGYAKIRGAILELRKGLSLSQDDFAQKLLVTRQAVSRWESGDTIPNVDTIKLIAKTFEVSVDYLLGHPAGQCQSCGMI